MIDLPIVAATPGQFTLASGQFTAQEGSSRPAVGASSFAVLEIPFRSALRFSILNPHPLCIRSCAGGGETVWLRGTGTKPTSGRCESVQGADNFQPLRIGHVCVDFCRLHIAVPQQPLNLSNVRTGV